MLNSIDIIWLYFEQLSTKSTPVLRSCLWGGVFYSLSVSAHGVWYLVIFHSENLGLRVLFFQRKLQRKQNIIIVILLVIVIFGGGKKREKITKKDEVRREEK